MTNKDIKQEKQCKLCDRPPTTNYMTFLNNDNEKYHICMKCYTKGRKNEY